MENIVKIDQAVPEYNPFSGILLVVLIFAFMYFMMWRPNKKRMEEYKKMLADLKVGSKIVFAGGIYGVIKSISETSLKVEIADGVVIEIPKSAVANIA
ncbi:MAG: preprotein translocase subunit YajC [Rickettsiales bacterium]|jgi:preprotein translocase subunit YajC|nr:preprotein translocase subunit YajC [Rickettsiales bacterium]